MLGFLRTSILFLVLFILASSSSFAVSVDSSLYIGTNRQLIGKYEHLLNVLNKPDNSNFDTQKTILYTLINILKYPNTGNIFDVKNIKVANQEDYLVLFKKIAALELQYMEIDGRIKDINKKLRVLDNAISSLDNTSKDVMTYQLQYAFYRITLKKLTTEKQTFEKNFRNWNDFLYRAFLKTTFNKKVAVYTIDKKMKEYDDLNDSIERLSIEKDRLTLLNRTDELSQIDYKLSKIVQLKDLSAMDIINNYILIGLYNLKHSNNLTKTQNNIDKWIGKLSLQNNIMLAKEENSLLYNIVSRKIGAFRAFMRRMENGSVHLAGMVWSFIKKPVFTIGGAHISIFNIFLALLVFIFGIYLGKNYQKRIKESKFSKNITLSTKTILGNVGYYVIVLITFFISLKIIGINLSSLTVILGALSVGIGFGLQNMVANFISGIILMLENSIRIGDYIEISDTLKGVVEDIQMRSTTIVTNDNIEVIIPNQTLFQNNVINWTLTEKVRRFRIPFGVAYGTDVEMVQKVVYDALKKSNLNYIKNVPDKAPELKMTAMNSSSVDFNLDVWVKGDDVVYPRRTESRFLIMIYNALYENGITIPFPQMDIHVKEPVILKRENKTK